MKIKNFLLDQRAVDIFFPAVRDKANIIVLLMNAIKYMLVDYEISDDNSKGSMILKVDKMSRLSFFTNEKYFSICFPFFVDLSDPSDISFSIKGIILDNKNSSEILSLIMDNNIFNSQDVLEFLDPIDQNEIPNSDLWCVLKELMLFEDGYLRYDYDEPHEDPIMHPKNHVDIFYETPTTFKLGLNNKPSFDDFLDMLDINTPCYFLTKTSV